MSKAISANLKTHMAGEVTTLCYCWKVVRTDSQEFFFTSLDIDIVYDGDTYEADSGFIPSSLDHTRALNVDELEVVAFLESTKITEADIQAGLWDYAEVDVFILNYENTAQNEIFLAKTFKLGEVAIHDNEFIGEIRGLTQHLQTSFIGLYGPGCRADLGDTKCGVDVAGSFTETGTVTGFTDRQVFEDSARGESEDVFAGGKLTWTSGNNNGYSMEVKKFDFQTEEFTLFLPMPYAIQVGDGYSVTYGCDKSKGTCKDRFNNIVNFRGEPFLPGLDGLMQKGFSGLDEQAEES
jgi:uncharacterized phage protein (TIGR02218 family)